MDEKNFEELRNQFAILKNQLQEQEIVNNRLLRETMTAKSSAISYSKKTCYGAVAFCLIAYPLLYLSGAWSLAFTIVTCLIMIFCAVATYYIHKPVEELNFMKDDFTTVARVMAKFKKQYNDWMHYIAPTLMIPWVIWACYDYGWKNAPEGINPFWMALPLLVGCAIGGLIGYSYHRKSVNAAQAIIDEIEEN